MRITSLACCSDCNLIRSFSDAACIGAGPLTGITMLMSPYQISTRAHANSSVNSWQLITGHSNGHVTLWALPSDTPMHPLAVLETFRSSPVKSMLPLRDHQLLCCGHADGYLTFYSIPDDTNPIATAQQPDASGLPCLKLQQTEHQAHRTGLGQCIMSCNGLLTLGTSGTILMWPQHQIGTIAEQIDRQQKPRYSKMHRLLLNTFGGYHNVKCP